jgi:hypothetical protein
MKEDREFIKSTNVIHCERLTLTNESKDINQMKRIETNNMLQDIKPLVRGPNRPSVSAVKFRRDNSVPIRK